LTTKQTIGTNSKITLDNIDQVVKKVVAEAKMSGYKVVKTEMHPEGRYYRFYSMISFPVNQTYLMQEEHQSNKDTENTKARLNKQINDLDKELERINDGNKNWN
jgi:uncharacterized protein YceH (UPF0502 family)